MWTNFQNSNKFENKSLFLNFIIIFKNQYFQILITLSLWNGDFQNATKLLANFKIQPNFQISSYHMHPSVQILIFIRYQNLIQGQPRGGWCICDPA